MNPAEPVTRNLLKILAPFLSSRPAQGLSRSHAPFRYAISVLRFAALDPNKGPSTGHLHFYRTGPECTCGLDASLIVLELATRSGSLFGVRDSRPDICPALTIAGSLSVSRRESLRSDQRLSHPGAVVGLFSATHFRFHS